MRLIQTADLAVFTYTDTYPFVCIRNRIKHLYCSVLYIHVFGFIMRTNDGFFKFCFTRGIYWVNDEV